MIIEKKLLGIFLLNDLEFSKIKDEINEGLNDKLNEISEEFVKTNTFHGGQHIRYLLQERTKRIREIVKSRLNLDLSYIEKAMIFFSDNIYQEIYKRVSDTIESEIEFTRNKMLHFCRNWPYPKDYLKLINQILDKEKDVLIKNTERDILIYKMNCELELKENEITTKKSSGYKKYKYKCCYKINIIGKDEDLKKENYIEIGGNGIELGKNNFILFVKLALELTRNNEGWVDIEVFVQEIDLSFSGRHQLIERLRGNLTKIKVLDNSIVKELIENKKSGLYRISTHPDFITYNKEKLINHKDPRVRELAENLTGNDK
jgi:hypothetical protein